MSTLSKEEIKRRMKKRSIANRLIVTPLLSEDQIGVGVVDLRLGTEFIFTARTEYPAIGLKPGKEKEAKREAETNKKDEIGRQIAQYQRRLRIEYGEKFVLHPHQFILGSTLEYIALPEGIFGYVLSRSSWGRVGLIIATATAVNPGFKGTLTLELVNVGEAPLILYPGLCIAQIALHTAGPGVYVGRHLYSTGPEFSKAYEDKELSFWEALKD